MADWKQIPDTDVDPDAPVTSELMYALRDNPVAIAEGAEGAPRNQDASLSSTVTSYGRNWVAQRIVTSDWNAVGQSVLAIIAAGTETVAAGTTLSGSGLRATSSNGAAGVSLPGTWRLQGQIRVGSIVIHALWLRIA